MKGNQSLVHCVLYSLRLTSESKSEYMRRQHVFLSSTFMFLSDVSILSSIKLNDLRAFLMSKNLI